MRVPYTNFKTRVGDDNAIGGCTFIGGEWKEVDTVEIFDNKKVIVFALQGRSRQLAVLNNFLATRRSMTN